MATTKKKAASTPREAASEALNLARAIPAKPRNVAVYEAAVAEFASATEMVGRGEFRDAKPRFDAIAVQASADEPILADRARSYASICERKTGGPELAGDDPDGLYHRGVVAANLGRLDDAWSLLERATAARPGDASFFYARASVRALQGAAEGAAGELKKAIALDPRFRFQATSDPDFDKVRDEAAFIDVIEPSNAGA